MSIKKHTLKNDKLNEYQVLGIATTESEFQILLLINNILSIKLSLAKSIKKETPLNTFPCFKYSDDDLLQIFLIKNKNKGATLFNNQQQFDFIIVIAGENQNKAVDLLSGSLKTQTNIPLVTSIDIMKLTNLKSFI